MAFQKPHTVVSVNCFRKGIKFGSVGLPSEHVEVKIAEDGEILVKGPNVMIGYYNLPDKTAEAIDSDGWFHTGDIGEFVDKKFLKITDRKKEIFKTSGGKIHHSTGHGKQVQRIKIY